MPTQAARASAARRAACLALQLDGSNALAACSGAAARAWLRLRVKWQDMFSGHTQHTSLPGARVWDSGHARDAAALARLRPRRPTFVIVDNGPAAALLDAMEALQAARAAFAHPVRLLWLLPVPAAENARDWAMLEP